MPSPGEAHEQAEQRWLLRRRLYTAFAMEEDVSGTIRQRVRGGLRVELTDFGWSAFLPSSQVSTRPLTNIDRFIGETWPLRILRYRPLQQRIVVSQRVILLEERERRRQEALEALKVGDIRAGVVGNITSYAVFVQVGALSVALHITDMTLGRGQLSDHFTEGETLWVRIIRIDRERGWVYGGLLPPGQVTAGGRTG